ncbi:MAG TPA: phosphoribosylanthranilate isomerase [Gemmatimonadales bacterium]|jgi:phosphoribosylanthranilate isomerase
MLVSAKICGLTRPEDAALAATHGAWRLGVVFAGGPRMVTVTQAAAIIRVARGVPVLGVFGVRPLGTILDIMERAGLAGAQLHGEHPPETASELRTRGYEVWRVVPIDLATDLAAELGAAADGADAVAIEARVPGGAGGRGVGIALDLARAARAAVPRARFVLAGGLGPDSVRRAIEVVGPDVVDVSSGIESSPGIKDPERLACFLENVLAARSAA